MSGVQRPGDGSGGEKAPPWWRRRQRADEVADGGGEVVVMGRRPGDSGGGSMHRGRLGLQRRIPRGEDGYPGSNRKEGGF